MSLQPLGTASNDHLWPSRLHRTVTECGGDGSAASSCVDHMRPFHAWGRVVEHRLSLRFELHVPVMFDWLDESGTWRQGGCFTRDVSETGVFAWCEGDCPPCFTVVRISLLLPGIEPTSKAWRMESTGYVVRVIDDVPGGRGFVAHLDELRTVLASASR
jgi:hypothetical protein